jgi:hypothetical protein
MKHRVNAAANTVVILALLLPSAAAYAISPQEMLRNLKDNLYQALAVKTLDDTSITTFVMALPGIPLDPTIDLTQPDDVRALYTLLNFVPTGDVTGQNSSDKMSDIYLRVLDGSKNLVENPKKPQLQQEADALETRWGGMYEAYFQYQQAYLTAQSAANVAAAKHLPTKEALQSTADQAKAAWELSSKGHKTQYELLRSNWKKLLFDIEGGEPWAARRAKYDTADNQGFPVFTWPRYSAWQSDNGWMAVSFSSSDLQRSEHHSTVQWGGSAGFFGFGARASGGTTVNTSQESLDKLSISFEVKRVLIDRPWLDASVFRSKKWTWKDPAETPISYGHFNTTLRLFEGRMPLLPTSIVLIRKVKLSSNWGSTVANEIRTGMGAAGGFSFGPFSIGGSYGNSSHDSSQRVQVTDAGIEIPDVQIIGWICDILPKSPNQ